MGPPLKAAENVINAAKQIAQSAVLQWGRR